MNISVKLTLSINTFDKYTCVISIYSYASVLEQGRKYSEKIAKMAGLPVDQSDSKDSVLWESVEEYKGEVETKNEDKEVESVYNLTEKAKRKRKRRSKRKANASDATAAQTIPKNNDLQKPSPYIPEEAAIGSASGLPIRALDYITYKDIYWEKGDVVSITDTKGALLYAVIRKILIYKNSEKGVLINWLLPKSDSTPPEKHFDPSAYVIGPEENSPFHIDYLRFIMTLPYAYYSHTDVLEINHDFN